MSAPLDKETKQQVDAIICAHADSQPPGSVKIGADPHRTPVDMAC